MNVILALLLHYLFNLSSVDSKEDFDCLRGVLDNGFSKRVNGQVMYFPMVTKEELNTIVSKLRNDFKDVAAVIELSWPHEPDRVMFIGKDKYNAYGYLDESVSCSSGYDFISKSNPTRLKYDKLHGTFSRKL